MRGFWLLFCCVTLLRALCAFFFPLGVDESYQISIGRDWSLSYYDHPPLSFWANNLFGKFGDHPFLYRLPSLIFGSISLYFIWRITADIASTRAAFIAALLYAAAPFFFLSGGVFVVPDPALNTGLLLAAWGSIQLMSRASKAAWLCIGMGLAIAFLSKYQGALMGITLLGLAVCEPKLRPHIRSLGFIFALALAVLGALPVLVWNINNDWASMAFHSGRTGGNLGLQNITTMLLGQAAYLLPATFIVLLCTLLQKQIWRTAPLRLLAWLGVIPIAFFNLIYLFSQNSLPHWTMPGWLMLIPLAAIWLEGRLALWRWRLFFTATAIPIWLFILLFALHARTGILTQNDAELPHWDDTREMMVLDNLAQKMQNWDPQPDYIAAQNWQDAARLDVALGGQWPIKVLGDTPHHYAYIKGGKLKGQGVLLIPDLLTHPKHHVENATKMPPILIKRGKRDYIRVEVFRLGAE